jgi:NADH-quinone oxidoreductase subunit G
MTETVNVKVDGREVAVPKGTNVIEAAKIAGVEIPHFCYHPQLSIAGNCRMCVVEVENQRGLPIACNTTVAEGMTVKTNTQKVIDTRAAVMEFLLINHPIDCPVCDQAGECKLQIYYMEHDKRDSLVPLHDKVEKGKAIEVGPRVMLDQERCVACSRCVRFCDEVTKTGELRLLNRADHTTIDVFPGKALDNNYSVNTADICPVGALTQRDFRFQARVWFLKDAETICPGCANGCNVKLSYFDRFPLADYNANAYRLRPRENAAVNEAWMCDFGRTEYKRINEERVKQPITGGIEVGWDGALASARNALHTARSQGAIAGIASFDCTNEEIWLFKKLMSEVFGQDHIALLPRRAPGFGDDFLIDPDKHPNTKGALLVGGAAVVADPAQYLKGKAAVIVLDADPLAAPHSEALRAAFAAVKHKIVMTANETEASQVAPVVLPTVSFAEKDGTWINRQGRVQRIMRAIRPRFDAKDDLQVMSLLAHAMGVSFDHVSARELFAQLAASVPGLGGIEWAKLGNQGIVLGQGASVAGSTKS